MQPSTLFLLALPCFAYSFAPVPWQGSSTTHRQLAASYSMRCSHSGGTWYVAAVDATAAERACADFACDGSADQVELQSALDSLVGQGGRVTLSSGTFVLDGPLRLVGGVRLQGQGRASTLRASAAFQSGEGILDGEYTGVGAPLDLIEVAHLTLDGNRFAGALTAGVHLRVASQAGFRFGSPDASFALQHVLISHTAGHGLHLEGSHNRGARIDDVRIWNAGGDGFRIQVPDATFTDSESGSSSGPGFHILNSNNHFTACKAWYSDASGFEIAAVRNTFSACSAQDNEQHGFAIRSGMNTLSACHADSNSYKGGPIPDPNQGLFDGFHIASSNVILSACHAYDKSEGGRGHNQRYGVFIQGSGSNLNLQVSSGNGGSHDNHLGGIGGTLNGPGTYIVATGQNTFVTP